MEDLESESSSMTSVVQDESVTASSNEEDALLFSSFLANNFAEFFVFASGIILGSPHQGEVPSEDAASKRSEPLAETHDEEKSNPLPSTTASTCTSAVSLVSSSTLEGLPIDSDTAEKDGENSVDPAIRKEKYWCLWFVLLSAMVVLLSIGLLVGLDRSQKKDPLPMILEGDDGTLSFPLIAAGGNYTGSPFEGGSTYGITNQEEDAGEIKHDARLDHLLDLLFPYVTRIEDKESFHLQDYVATSRNDKSIVARGSPQHNALVWLSHSIVCEEESDPIVLSRKVPTLSSKQEGVYQCEALLSKFQLLHRYALATLYFAWNGKSWKDAHGWLSYDYYGTNEGTEQSLTKGLFRYPSDVCTWKGVVCSKREQQQDNTTTSVEEERITGLVLPHNNLVGSMGVFTEIGLLQSLETIDFSANHLTGRIPASIGEVSQLTSLVLSQNKLEGSFPTKALDTLTKLEVLRLEGNLFVSGLEESLGLQPPCRYGFIELVADCLGTKPKIVCPCCTSCCGTSIGNQKDHRFGPASLNKSKPNDSSTCINQMPMTISHTSIQSPNTADGH